MTTLYHVTEDPAAAAASLEKLKDWIDEKPLYVQKDKTAPTYLYKPEFSAAVLKEGLIYAVSEFKRLAEECQQLDRVANQYNGKVDFGGWASKFGLDAPKDNMCLENEIQSEEYEEEIRAVDVESEPKFRRMIAIMAVMAHKMYELKKAMANEIVIKGQDGD